MRTIISNVTSVSQAIQILLERGIEFVDIAETPIYCKIYYSNRIERKDSVHKYFMNEQNKDVAYYTPIMNTLFIHSEPRTWGQKYIDKAEFHGRERIARSKELILTSPELVC